MNDLGTFYRGKRVFLTGHTGFKGSWLALWLSQMGASVHGYALEPSTQPALFQDARVWDCLASHTIGDVRDSGALAGAVRRAEPEMVFHLAAQALVRQSYREPRQTFETNVLGAVNVLEAVRMAGGVRVCQVITSDKCYENREWVYAYRENDAMGGFDPYSASKGCAELAVAAWRQSFFNPHEMERHGVSVSSARAGNVIGGGDWAEDRIIPDCIRALEQSKPILVRNPRAIRPWQHVLEPLSGYLTLAMRQWEQPAEFADAYNFGPAVSGAVSVGEIADLVVRHWGDGSWHGPEAGAPSGLHEANFLKLDITKAATRLGWRPVWSVGEAVARTVEWYRRRAAGSFDAAAFCMQQITDYEGAAGAAVNAGR